MAIRKSQVFLSLANSYFIDSPQPSTLNYWYNLGSLLGLCLIIQICSGIFLAMHYSSHIDLAFASVEHIMRDVNYGYLIRYIHANGASFFFICMYAHIGKALYYGSYKSPRVLVWVIGVIIFVITMATAFLGKKHNSCPKSLKSPSIIKNIKNINSKNILKHNINKFGPLILKSSLHTKITQDIHTPEEIIKLYLPDNFLIENYWDNLHLSSTRKNILTTVKNKSGIYIIINKITGNKYIGSAITNKLHVRFANHCIHSNHGSKLVKQGIKKYGLNNFIFGVIEYYPDIINKYNNIELLKLEQTYLNLLEPEYNILTEAGNSFGYKHSEETLSKMKSLYTEERKEILRKFQENRKGKWSDESKLIISQSNINRSAHLVLNTKEQLEKRSNMFSKTIYLKLNNSIICEFKNINIMCNYICCSERTIRRAIKSNYIYIPINYIPYLNNELITKFNCVKDNDITLQTLDLKSGLTYKNTNLKKYEVSREK